MKGAWFLAIGLAAAVGAQLAAAANTGFAPAAGVAPLRTPARNLNLNVVDSVDWLTVYGVRRAPRLSPPSLAYAPAASDAATPRNLRIVPPSSCPGMAYMTVAGQPATGNVLMGALGSGDCW